MRRAMVLLLAGAMMTLATPALAAGATTETFTEQGGTRVLEDETGPFCAPGDPLYDIVLTYNVIAHTTTFPDGRVHATFTETGWYDAVPQDDGVAHSGHYTVWGGFNENKKTVSGTFTFTIKGAFADGTKINFHFVEHGNVTPNGAVFAFSRCID